MHSLRISFGRSRLLAVLGAAVAASASTLAGVTVIHEGGPTVPIGQYLAGMLTQEPAAPKSALPARSDVLPMAFPVATPSMRPGSLPAPLRLRTAGWLVAPMFIVGDDQMSRQWLAANHDKLRRLGASGLVVNVPSPDAFRSLRTVAPDVAMAPGSVEALARQAGLSVYPLYVAPDGQVSQMVP
jgi:integrating conjugative element protein (TIGR03765 family)